jgi:ammonia channel protein AmtB
MVMYAFAAVMVCWGVWGYQMAFGAQMIPGLVGIPRPILSSYTELKQVSILTCCCSKWIATRAIFDLRACVFGF